MIQSKTNLSGPQPVQCCAVLQMQRDLQACVVLLKSPGRRTNLATRLQQESLAAPTPHHDCPTGAALPLSRSAARGRHVNTLSVQQWKS